MEVREFTADEPGPIRLGVEIENAHHVADCPWQLPLTPYRLEMEMRHGWDGELGRYFLAHEAGVAVGLATLDLSDWDNLDLAWLGITIRPEHRRRGHGTGVLEELLALSRDAGRSLVGIDGWESPGVDAFAAANGLERKSQAINRRMHLATIDLAAVDALRDRAAEAASDYELVRVAGRTPEDLVDAVSEMTAAINDAPTDDLEYEDERYPPERIRSYENATIESGHRLYRLIARHRGSGALAGHTVVAVDAESPDRADQHDTSVVRAHRGHRLGLLLKAEMVDWLAGAEPRLSTVDTWNAESNQHMIAVNDALGYQVMGREIQYQRRF